jgi:hypothetical protein
MSKLQMFAAFGLGQPFTLFTENVYVTGTITGITLESGFFAPNTPHHFNVTMMVKKVENPNFYAHNVQIGQYREFYVKTID